MTGHIEVYTEQRRTGRLGLRKRTQYRWRIKSSNGRIIATGSEGYNNITDLWHAVCLVTNILAPSLTKPVPIHDGEPQ